MCFQSCKINVIDSGSLQHAIAIGIAQSDVIWRKFTAHSPLTDRSPVTFWKDSSGLGLPAVMFVTKPGSDRGRFFCYKPLQDDKKFVSASTTLCGIFVCLPAAA